MNINIAKVDYDGLIPNNVALGDDPRVKRALEKWHPGYIDWWKDMGPEGFQESLVYLRTAVSVDPKGWAKFDYVRMPEYRWGVLLAPQMEGRKVNFGTHKGEPAWQEVPGEYRAMLRRLVVIQGDTEPASVEQQRHLGKTAPSLYDMRNLFQVNVEEGRHLWAMVYLLQKYFGTDGREEAEALLQRRSGDPDTPRMLGAFNEKTPDWLSFFMFTFFTDRDGKMQLEALAQSGFDPLSRTCRFMLTEEAHHMFVGETGISRVVQRTCEAMKAARAPALRPAPLRAASRDASARTAAMSSRMLVLPSQAISTKPAANVPTMLPMVDMAYRFPAVWPPVRLWESLSRTANGATMPKSTEGGANNSSVDHTAAMCNPASCDWRNPSTRDLVKAMAAVAKAASRMIRPSSRASGRRSATRPPHQEPRLSEARMIPIRLVQTTREVPR